MLTIVRASDPMPVEQLVVCVYAAPGLGKTSLGFTAEKPLLLDFDNGAYRAGNRKDTVKVGAWSDIEQMTKGDFTPFKTLIVDTAGRALDVLSLDIMQKNPKHGRGSGALSASTAATTPPAVKSRSPASHVVPRRFATRSITVRSCA